jgi:cyclopropane-fatty-acyl-phospholipid synthase
MTDTTSGNFPRTRKRLRGDLIEMLGRALAVGRLSVTTPGGATYRFAADLPGPSAALNIHKPGFARKLLTGGDVGFAEAYIEGICDTPDLTRLIELGALNEHVSWNGFLEGGRLFRWFARLGHRFRPNSKRGARRNIREHYDLGNDFYAAWLDPTMTYSAAVYPAADVSLEEAQRCKYQRLIEKLDLNADHHLLEIGCGWGGFAVHAAETIGCKVTAVTISEAQYRYAATRIAEAGLTDRIDLKLLDYRDLEGRFDRIVSIEMLEAVGEAYWPVYFEKLNALLRRGGRAAIQVITIDADYWQNYRNNPDFIQRYIFPGGMLPTVERLQNESARAGLSWEDCCGYGADYARTLAAWRDSFEMNWPVLRDMGFDEKFRRMWRYYLCYCEAGFNVGRIDVQQIALQRP